MDPVREGALSHPKRLEMLGYLKQQKTGADEEKLVEALGLPASRVKYHLSVLQSADLIAPVSDRDQGRYVVASSAGP
jgi:DNA-binding transcriptional ArsR family regulator